MSELVLRELGPDDRGQVVRLGTLAFGGDPAAPEAPAPPGARSWGLFDGDRLVAKATWRSYVQWWGGRRVPMGGLAGVAVHPDARGSGAARRLVRHLLVQMRDAGEPVSALFPTAPGIYRPLGWEVVGALEETVLPTAALRGATADGVGDAAPATVRGAGHDDLVVLARLWQEHARCTDGALSRDGPSFPRGAEPVLAHDVVAIAEQDGVPTGYLAYDRGRGYGIEAALRVAELVALTAQAQRALLRSLGSWDAVAGVVRWRGPLAEQVLQLPASVPAAAGALPWMLRITDAPAAVAARGYRHGVRVQAAVTLVDPDVPEHAGPWQLTVDGGAGSLARTDPGPPRLHVRGMALLFAGVTDSARLLRAGLLEAPVPGLDALAGPAPVLLDDF